MYIVSSRLVVDRVLGGEHSTRNENAEEERVAEPAMVAHKVTRLAKAVVGREHEQRVGLGYWLNLLDDRIQAHRIYCLRGTIGDALLAVANGSTATVFVYL